MFQKIILFSLFIFLANSCSSTSKQVDRDVKGMHSSYSREEMIDRMRDVIDGNPKISEDQKERFLNLHVAVMEDVGKINQNIRKLKVLLFKEMSNEYANEKRMDSIISKIKKQHSDKLHVMIRAFQDAKEILGINFKEIDYERFHHPFIVNEEILHNP